MTTLLSMTPADQIVPLFAIVFTFMVPIVAIYLYYQNKNKILDERRLMIEKGMTPPPLNDLNQKEYFQPKSKFTKGLNLIAIALGLLVGYFISSTTNIEAPFSIGGSILFFLGIVNIISAVMQNTSNQENSSSINTFNNEK